MNIHFFCNLLLFVLGVSSIAGVLFYSAFRALFWAVDYSEASGNEALGLAATLFVVILAVGLLVASTIVLASLLFQQ